MTTCTALQTYLNQLLQPERFDDYCPNGLQVEGSQGIQRLITGVTASEALLHAAIEHKADAILVHHGYFWKRQSPCVVGMQRQRLALLLQHNINLLAYHLPLDAHPIYGNNAQLAKRLSIEVQGRHPDNAHDALLWHGTLDTPLSAAQCIERLQIALEHPVQHLPSGRGSEHLIQSIGWCSGAGQFLIEKAAQLGLDAYITGEASEATFHVSQELGIHGLIAGHHATERYGVQALGAHLAEHFGLEHTFVDIDNPV